MRAVNGAVTATDMPYSCWASRWTLGRPSPPSLVGSVSRSHCKSLEARRPSIAGTRVDRMVWSRGAMPDSVQVIDCSCSIHPATNQTMRERWVCSLWMTLRKDGKALNFLDPGSDHVIHATFHETGLTQWCTKAESTLGSDLHSSVGKHCFHILELLWFYNEPRLPCIGKISVKWTLLQQGIPPQTKGQEATASWSIVGKPHLWCATGGNWTNQRYHSEGIHGHGEGISLGGPLHWMNNFPHHKKFSTSPIGVC